MCPNLRKNRGNEMNERLAKQMGFIIEIDKVKSIFRRTVLSHTSRLENDAEHAWHISLMAVILYEYANEKDIDLLKVIKMLLVHDLVEIDAGDVAIYDLKARKNNKENEERAAMRIFGMLPDDQRDEMLSLWDEFEARVTPESRFAEAMDRIEPIMQNYLTGGHTWKELNASYEMVHSTNQHLREGSEDLWEYIEGLLNVSFEKGFFK
jgi:putative hydrolase of HD superfamily